MGALAVTTDTVVYGDLDAIRRTAQLVKSAGINAFVLFNAAQPEQPRCLRTRGVSWQAPD